MEGFGEIPLESLDALLLSSRGDEDDDLGWSQDRRVALAAKVQSLREQRRESIQWQELVQLLSRKRSYSFRRAVARTNNGASRNKVCQSCCICCS